MSTKQYWIVKYALSSGAIACRNLEPGRTDSDGYAYDRSRWGGPILFRIGHDCFESRDDAFAAAEAMRKRRIASLEKQIAKLRQMQFVAKEPA